MDTLLVTKIIRFGDKDDVIGSYSVSAETGLITFTPRKNTSNLTPQEHVNIEVITKFIAIQNHPVTYDAATKVTSVNDNQYGNHGGAVFNGETITSELTGWDNADSASTMEQVSKMTNGHGDLLLKVQMLMVHQQFIGS